MHILFLTQIVPYPPDAGPKVKTWHVLRYLVERGHSVHLATFVRPEERPYLPELKKICASVSPVPMQRSRIKDLGFLLKSLFSGKSFLITRDDLPGMRQAVKTIQQENDIQVIHSDQLSMAQFAFPPGREIPTRNGSSPALVFDAHNAVWTILSRSQETARWFFKPLLARESRAIMRHEAQLVGAYDQTLAVTEEDKKALLEAVAGQADMGQKQRTNLAAKITVIPIAVNTQELLPVNRKPNSLNIVTLGTLHYPPNADGIRWFAQDVFPHIQASLPRAKLTIIGKNPPADFQQMAKSQPESIQVTGYVPDLTPYFEDSAVMVVPVRAGGGMRVRILEAFARGMPVITTTVGLEGIDAKIGEDVLVEDSPEKFAQTTIHLLRDPNLQSQLAARGRILAEQLYDWQVVLEKLDHVYAKLAAEDFPTRETAIA